MWNLFNRKDSSQLQESASSSTSTKPDMNNPAFKIPVEARPMDDKEFYVQEPVRHWPVTMRFPSMGSERYSMDEGERRSLSAASAEAAVAADTRRTSTDGTAASGSVPRSRSVGRFDLDHMYTNWPSA